MARLLGRKDSTSHADPTVCQPKLQPVHYTLSSCWRVPFRVGVENIYIWLVLRLARVHKLGLSYNVIWHKLHVQAFFGARLPTKRGLESATLVTLVFELWQSLNSLVVRLAALRSADLAFEERLTPDQNWTFLVCPPTEAFWFWELAVWGPENLVLSFLELLATFFWLWMKHLSWSLISTEPASLVLPLRCPTEPLVKPPRDGVFLLFCPKRNGFSGFTT